MMDRSASRLLVIFLRSLIAVVLVTLTSFAVAASAKDLEPVLGSWAVPAAIALIAASIGFICLVVRFGLYVPNRKLSGSSRDISEHIDELEIHTVVVVIGEDGFPAAYRYCGVSDSGSPQWLGLLMDHPEPLEQWSSDRILGVYRPSA